MVKGNLIIPRQTGCSLCHTQDKFFLLLSLLLLLLSSSLSL